jgi:hypothetical protein
MGERRPEFVVDLADPASLQSWADILKLPVAALTKAATQARSRNSPSADLLVQQVLDGPVASRSSSRPYLLEADEYEPLVLPSL